MKTRLNHWFHMVNEGDTYPTYTRDSWEIPEQGGAVVWCDDWESKKIIKPYGDGCHVLVGTTVFHCDQFMEIMIRKEEEGHKWGMENVRPTREQYIAGRWVKVSPQLVVRDYDLLPGQTYTNKNGDAYLCQNQQSRGSYLMKRISDGWTLEAHIISLYEDGTIVWDYSTGGHWPDGVPAKS